MKKTNNAQDKRLAKARRIGRQLNLLSLFAPKLAGKLSVHVFATPFNKAEIREADSEFLDTGRSLQIQVNGLSIQGYAWGPESAPAVLLAHGWESHSARWKYYIPQLMDSGFQVISFDAPGHGRSGGKQLHLPLYTATLVKAIETYGPFHAVVGHSFGGTAVAMAVAESRQPQPEALVIMGSFAEAEKVLRNFSKLLQLREGTTQAMFSHIEALRNLPISHYSVLAQAPKLQPGSVLVIHDKQDKVVSVDNGRRIAQAIANTRYIETDGYGHRLQDAAVVDMVVDFIQRTLSAHAGY